MDHAKRILTKLLSRKGVRSKPDLPLNLVFCHVPKCAGTAVSKILSNHFDLSANLPIQYIAALKAAAAFNSGIEDEIKTMDYSHFLLRYNLEKKAKYTSGHYYVPLSLIKDYKEDFFFLTTLRDPVERWISHYVFDRVVHFKNYSFELQKFESDRAELEQFIQSPRGIHMGNIYLYHYSVNPADPAREGLPDLEKAKECLNHFDLVGFDDDMESFLAKLSNRLGLHLDNQNVNAISSGRSAEEKEKYNALMSLFDEKTKQDIHNLCKEDYALYDYAREKFRK